MTIVLIDTNARVVSNFFEMNYKGMKSVAYDWVQDNINY